MQKYHPLELSKNSSQRKNFLQIHDKLGFSSKIRRKMNFDEFERQFKVRFYISDPL
jgi:hypothetical protein